MLAAAAAAAAAAAMMARRSKHDSFDIYYIIIIIIIIIYCCRFFSLCPRAGTAYTLFTANNARATGKELLQILQATPPPVSPPVHVPFPVPVFVPISEPARGRGEPVRARARQNVRVSTRTTYGPGCGSRPPQAATAVLGTVMRTEG